MYYRWILTIALYFPWISEQSDYPLATRCKGIPYDVIHATEKTCYTLHRSKKSWRQAQQSCEQLGGNLAVLPNANDSNRIKLELISRQPEFLQELWWIGAEEGEYGSFFWLDGREVQHQESSSISSTIRGWLRLQKRCLTLSLIPLMDLQTCTNMFGYICEHDIATNGSNQEPTTLPTQETRVASPTPDQHDTTGEVDSVTTFTHDNKLWTTTLSKEIERTVQQKDGTQRSLTLTLLDIDKVEELPVPRVWRNVKYLNLCVFRCHGDNPQYNIMGYNIRTNQCMCYKTGDDTVTLDDNDRDGAIYYTLQTMVY